MEEELAGCTKSMRYLTRKQESKAIPDCRSANRKGEGVIHSDRKQGSGFMRKTRTCSDHIKVN